MDYDTTATTWHPSHHVAAGSPVIVQWRPDCERVLVHEVVSWGNRPLFDCPLENIGQYVRSTKGPGGDARAARRGA